MLARRNLKLLGNLFRGLLRHIEAKTQQATAQLDPTLLSPITRYNRIASYNLLQPKLTFRRICGRYKKRSFSTLWLSMTLRHLWAIHSAPTAPTLRARKEHGPSDNR